MDEPNARGLREISTLAAREMVRFVHPKPLPIGATMA
jgi:hypothetical protein